MTDLSKLGNLQHYLPRNFNPQIRDAWIENIAKNIPPNSKILESTRPATDHLFPNLRFGFRLLSLETGVT